MRPKPDSPADLNPLDVKKQLTTIEQPYVVTLGVLCTKGAEFKVEALEESSIISSTVSETCGCSGAGGIKACFESV